MNGGWRSRVVGEQTSSLIGFMRRTGDVAGVSVSIPIVRGGRHIWIIAVRRLGAPERDHDGWLEGEN